MMLPALPLAAALLQPLLAPLVLLCAAGAAFYGFRRGLFRATLLGLQALAAVMLALALEPPLAAWLELTEVPPAYALPGAFVAVLVAAAVGLMLLVNAVVPADALRLQPKIDQIGGAAVGLVAGVIASGGLLVALSMTPLPAAYRPDFGRLALDTGSAVLTTFARSLGYDARTVSLVLDGEPGARIDPGTKPRPAAWSEPFVDTNANVARDPDEPFLDTDADGAFTPQLAANDVNDDGRRDVGILEHYRLGNWTPLRVLQAPALTGEDSEFVTDGAPATTVVYQAAATDVDVGDTLRFSLKPDQEDDAALVTLDPTTGAVTLKSPPDRAARPVYTFTVVVTDRAGLVAEKPVTIYVTKGREPDRESTPQPAPDPS